MGQTDGRTGSKTDMMRQSDAVRSCAMPDARFISVFSSVLVCHFTRSVSVSDSSPVHIFEPLFWTGQLLDNFSAKESVHFLWIDF